MMTNYSKLLLIVYDVKLLCMDEVVSTHFAASESTLSVTKIYVRAL